MKNEPQSQVLLYQASDGRTRLEVRLQDETVWLSLNQLAELFQRDKSVISRHIKNVFDEGELTPQATVAKFATVQTEGAKQVARDIEFYNLDVIISVGYRVLKTLNGDAERIAAARTHMKELFNATKGFGVGRRPSREEMHERESLTGNRVPLQADSTQWIHSLKRCKMAMK